MSHGKLVGVVGPKQAGKDSLAGFLVERHGFARLAFADVLKRYALGVDPLVPVIGYGGRAETVRLSAVVAARGWDRAKEDVPEVRRLLQEMGLAARLYLGDRVWLDPVMRQADELRAHGVSVVITDVRFPNELDAVRQRCGTVVRVTRPRTADPADAHASEQLWRTAVPDLEYGNVGTLWELSEFAARVAAA